MVPCCSVPRQSLVLSIKPLKTQACKYIPTIFRPVPTHIRFKMATPQITSEARLEAVVSVHPQTLEFKAREGVKAVRNVLTIQPEDEANNLTLGTLGVPETLAVKPFVFTDDAEGAILVFYHIGRRMAGHPGIVHGGLAAVLLDECMGHIGFAVLHTAIVVTARLEIDYKNPIPVDSLVCVSAKTAEVQGRKATIDAIMTDAESGKELVKARALFVAPKWADKAA